jgi:hypothetical protein
MMQENQTIPRQSLMDFLWEYFYLNKQQKVLAQAISIANKKAIAHNKRYYVFRLSDGKFYILNSNEIKSAKKRGLFKASFTIDKILETKLHIAEPNQAITKKLSILQRIKDYFYN